MDKVTAERAREATLRDRLRKTEPLEIQPTYWETKQKDFGRALALSTKMVNWAGHVAWSKLKRSFE